MRIKRLQLKKAIRRILLEMAKPFPKSVGEAFELYPLIYEYLCDGMDIDTDYGYYPGSPEWNQTIEEFFEETAKLDTDLFEYGLGDPHRALLALELLTPEGPRWLEQTYSSIDLDKAMQVTITVCLEFGIPEPEDLEGTVADMQWNRDADRSIGPSTRNWMKDRT